MENNRDSRGCFVKGHPGMKRKGAISKRDKEYIDGIRYVLNLLEKNIEEEIKLLKPKQKMDLWVHLLRYVCAKPPRMNLDEINERETPTKVTFVVRDCNNCGQKL
jgi:hypothetical protein